MKKLLFFAACTVAVASCNQDAVKRPSRLPCSSVILWSRLLHRKTMRSTT